MVFISQALLSDYLFKFGSGKNNLDTKAGESGYTFGLINTEQLSHYRPAATVIETWNHNAKWRAQLWPEV